MKVPRDVLRFHNLSDVVQADGHFHLEFASYDGRKGVGEIVLRPVDDRRRIVSISIKRELYT